MSGFRQDYGRLAAAMVATAMPALGLALVSAATLLALGLAAAAIPNGDLLLAPLFFWLHGLFVITLTWRQVKTRQPLIRSIAFPGLPAGALLALPIGAFALLDAHGASYSCADGLVFGRSAVPNLPWLWIGWTLLAVTALPARVIGLVVRERPPLISSWSSALLALPFMPILFVAGFIFQWRGADCTAPFGGFGLFEGGLVLMPLLGLFWFLLSYSLALVAGTSVDAQPQGAEARPARDDGSG